MIGRIIAVIVGLVSLVLVCTACEFFDTNDSGEDVSYDICDDTMLPEELLNVINMKKEEEFKLTFSNNTYTYIVVCAGAEEREGIIVDVDEVYSDGNAIYIKTVLRKDPSVDNDAHTVTFPYTVVRIAKTELPVIFK